MFFLFFHKSLDVIEKKVAEEEQGEVKFEWQRGAPREAYAKSLGIEARDQPFGIAVRNVKCIKCGKWGHINTDRECPLFNKSKNANVDPSLITDIADPMRLLKDMRTEGLTLKQNVLGRVFDPGDPNQQIVASDEESGDDAEAAFLASLTDKQKKKLLRKLDRLEREEIDAQSGHKKQKKKKRKRDNSPDSEEESSKHSKTKHHRETDSSDSDESKSKRKSKKKEKERKSRELTGRDSEEKYKQLKDSERDRLHGERHKDTEPDRRHNETHRHSKDNKPHRHSNDTEVDERQRHNETHKKSRDTRTDRHHRHSRDDKTHGHSRDMKR